MLFDLLRLASLGQNMELYASLQIRQPTQPNSSSSSAQDPLITQRHRASNFVQAHPPPHPTHQNNSQHPPQSTRQQQAYDAAFSCNKSQQQANCHQQHLQQAAAAECKPLDLSVQSFAKIATTSDKILEPIDDKTGLIGCNRERRRRPRPAPILLVPVSGHRQRHNRLSTNVAGRRDRRLCNATKSSRNKQVKLNHKLIISSSTSPSSCSHSASSVCSSLEESSIKSSAANERVITSTNGGNGGGHKRLRQPSPTSGLRRQKLKGPKSHLCQQCGRSFSRSDMLTRHSRLHSGLKPYQCSRCKQVFSRSDHLSTHERTHTGEKPYQCEYCSYSACRRDMITRHMRTHSGAASTKSPKSFADDAPDRSNSVMGSGTVEYQTPVAGSQHQLLAAGYPNDDDEDDISTSSLDEDNEDTETTVDNEESPEPEEDFNLETETEMVP